VHKGLGVEERLQGGVEEAGVADVEKAVAAAGGGQRQQALARRLQRALVCQWDVGEGGAALHGEMQDGTQCDCRGEGAEGQVADGRRGGG
jgi:hypothetical protein